MQGLRRRWKLSRLADGAAGEAHLAALSLPQRILAARGMTDEPLVERFVHPRLTHLHDPGLLPQVDLAADRLIRAIRGRERIVIYGDYDVDGITATAILYHLLKALDPDASIGTYVPHRLDEGYGINSDALRELRAGGASLVVSVDCGITAVEPAKVAAEIGLDLIITDHHNLPDPPVLPAAAAIVHPALPGSTYPFAALCGAGVAFKLAWRLATAWCGCQRVGRTLQQKLLDLLPLAALGTIADVVPLLDENRVLASHGLRAIKETPLHGLRALIEVSGLSGEAIDSEKVGFCLGPRLNACGRMGHAAEAVRLLTEASPEEAAAIAATLGEMNRQRQQTERAIFEEAREMAERAGMTDEGCRVIVLAQEAWHPGVVGIVCSRLVERYGRPVVLLNRQNDVCRGSARSIEGYSIHGALCDCAELLESFGGHDAAAGLTLRAEHLEAFTAALRQHAGQRISPGQLTAELAIDCDASLAELDLATVRRLAALAPFGRCNRPPTVRVRNLTLAEPPRALGAHGRHISLRLRDGQAEGARWLRTVWWNAADLSGRLAAGMTLDAAIEPKINVFNGQVNVEAEMRDVIVKGSGAAGP